MEVVVGVSNDFAEFVAHLAKAFHPEALQSLGTILASWKVAPASLE